MHNDHLFQIIIFIESGIPNSLECSSQTTPLLSSIIPLTNEAAAMYTSKGGTLTKYPLFGSDPLTDHQYHIMIRERKFFQKFICFDNLFADTVSSSGELFQLAVLDFIAITEELSRIIH